MSGNIFKGGEKMDTPNGYNQKIYLLSLFLYNFARVLPHAVLTVILLDKGMTVSEIAMVQSFYMLAAIIFEFPSGLLTDLLSEKAMYQLSLVLIGISYVLIMVTNTFYLLCLAWFIYGMSSASMSGSLDSYFIRRAEDSGQIKHVNVLINHALLYSGLIGGGLGSFLYAVFFEHIYLISLFMIALSLFLITFLFHADKRREKTASTEALSELMVEFGKIRQQKCLILIIMMTAVFQIITQLFYQFWQVSFLSRHFSKTYFGLLYILFQVIAIVSNVLFSRHDFSKSLGRLAACLGTLMLLSVIVPGKFPFLLLVVMYLIPFNLYGSQLAVSLQKEAGNQVMASVISFSGTVSSMVSVISLWVVGILNDYFPFDYVEAGLILVFLSLSSLLLVKYSAAEKQ